MLGHGKKTYIEFSVKYSKKTLKITTGYDKKKRIAKETYINNKLNGPSILYYKNGKLYAKWYSINEVRCGYCLYYKNNELDHRFYCLPGKYDNKYDINGVYEIYDVDKHKGHYLYSLSYYVDGCKSGENIIFYSWDVSNYRKYLNRYYIKDKLILHNFYDKKYMVLYNS